MDKVIAFPDTKRRDIEFPEATVTIQLKEGEKPLTISTAIYLLEMAKFQLVDWMKESEA